MRVEMTLKELSELVGGRVAGDGAVVISGVAGLEEAGPGEITFVASPRSSNLLAGTKASAVIVAEGVQAPEGKNLLVVGDPMLAFAKVLEVLRPAERFSPGVDPASCVHPTARVDASAAVRPFAVVEKDAVVGPRAVLYPGVYVGHGAVIGADSILYPGVAVREGCLVGERVIIHCNTVIGSDGFGYTWDGKQHYKVPQRGIVRIEDDVEIGACVTVDRATLGETVIGRGTKVDNLVQIAHNVRVGEGAIIVAQVGISGSTRIGSHAQLAGQVGVAGHIEVGDGTRVGAKSGVVSSVPAGSVVSGMPAIPHGEWLRAQSIFSRLPEMRKKVSELEKRLKRLEEKEAGAAEGERSAD